MRNIIGIALSAPLSLLASVPAHAAGSTALPEPGAMMLLSMGVAGVLIGRRFARKPPQD